MLAGDPGQWLASAAVRKRSPFARRFVLGCAVLSAAAAGAASAAGAAAPTSNGCQQGRTILQCSEKLEIYQGSYTASIGGFGDLILFETKLPLPISNPALSRFWSYQAATSIAAAELDSSIINQETDDNIEQIATRANLRAPVVQASGVVDSRTAAALSRLLLAEQQQVVNLEAMETALNRATAAQIERQRPDWARYQQSAAGGFALHAAAATGRMITLQKAASQALVAKKLLFGVGPVDLKMAQQTVKKAREFIPMIGSLLLGFGVTTPMIGAAEVQFVLANLGPTSVSLSQYLDSTTLIGGERNLITALRHYAARIPHAGRPPLG